MSSPKDASCRLRAASKTKPPAGADTHWASMSPTSAPTKHVNDCAGAGRPVVKIVTEKVTGGWKGGGGMLPS